MKLGVIYGVSDEERESLKRSHDPSHAGVLSAASCPEALGAFRKDCLRCVVPVPGLVLCVRWRLKLAIITPTSGKLIDCKLLLLVPPVICWITSMVARRYKAECFVDPPITSRIFHELNQGHMSFMEVARPGLQRVPALYWLGSPRGVADC